jgi:hemerythrin
MGSFEWSDSFITGIAVVDQQHRRLTDMVNRFGDGLSQNQVSQDDLCHLLGEMGHYASEHFRDEETLMQDAGIDPRHYAAHFRVHRDFELEVQSMASDILDPSQGSARHLLDFLMHWLAYHILGMDQNMARQLELIEQGIDPGEAFELAEKESDSSTEPLLLALSGLFEQVSAQNRALQRLNRDLEKKVEERTRELSRANAVLKAMSLTDSLTGLPNRRHAMEMLDVLWKDSTEHALDLVCIMIDADHFKQVNDSYGHDAGDEVLKEVALTLLHSFHNDDVVCRLGGDEFFVICPSTDLAGGMKIAEDTRQRVSQMRVATGGDPWVGSISVGVAARTAAMQKPDELVKKADQSVYAAKHAGKNCVRKVQN